MLGIKQLVVTNAAGGVNPRFKPGDFMLISDHISSFIPNPLVGPNWKDAGTRFPDMSQCYSPRFRQIAHQCAKQLKLRLREGVYVAVSGPSYETPAEIRMFQRLGGDAIGMSTVPGDYRGSPDGSRVFGNFCHYKYGRRIVEKASQPC